MSSTYKRAPFTIQIFHELQEWFIFPKIHAALGQAKVHTSAFQFNYIELYFLNVKDCFYKYELCHGFFAYKQVTTKSVHTHAL